MRASAARERHVHVRWLHARPPPRRAGGARRAPARRDPVPRLPDRTARRPPFRRHVPAAHRPHRPRPRLRGDDVQLPRHRDQPGRLLAAGLGRRPAHGDRLPRAASARRPRSSCSARTPAGRSPSASAPTTRGCAACGLLSPRADFDDWAEHPRRFLEHAREIGAIRSPAFPASFDEWSRAFRRFRPIDAARRFAPRPLLVMHGDDDESVPTTDARQLAEAHGERRAEPVRRRRASPAPRPAGDRRAARLARPGQERPGGRDAQPLECQRYADSTISSSPCLARQPSTDSAFVGSAYVATGSPAPAADDLVRDGSAGDRLGRPDHVEHGRSDAGPEVHGRRNSHRRAARTTVGRGRGCGRRRGPRRGCSRGCTCRRASGSRRRTLHRRPGAEHGLHHERDEVDRERPVLADRRVVAGAGGVEVAQARRAQALGHAVPVEDPLDHRLAARRTRSRARSAPTRPPAPRLACRRPSTTTRTRCRARRRASPLRPARRCRRRCCASTCPATASTRRRTCRRRSGRSP